MGIIKISDDVHNDVRRASQVMSRSINAQAEFWIKIGRLAERNPTMSFSEIIQMELDKADALEAAEMIDQQALA
ncbi:ParD-like family protein [Marinomonas ostreistagni]|uniref:ParD-like family protein n=1 Tax=Marinomonas ostreistagni TaxID=359209 RepID=A0ABS0ZDF4_9GAMM|nr:ParD-like family protein [Marinomonas ostreistagni]MBJ7551719.1 ParD-like family protein [Marinomonas ostreistagni]